MTVRVAINGFGRTGRAVLRSLVERPRDVEVVGLNDLAEPTALAHLLARDSVHGRFRVPVGSNGSALVVGDRKIELFNEVDAARLPWGPLGVDVVLECTGQYTTRERAGAHLVAGATRVIISAPAEDSDATFVLGVNEDAFEPTAHRIISNASCTTNCLALLAKVLDEAFSIEAGLMTTVHAYTDDQRLVDTVHHDPRRARAAALNIVPTSSGAARAIGRVLPEVDGNLDGLALRVPVPDASITDLVAYLGCAPRRDEVNEAFRHASRDALKGLLEYADEPLVSSDVVGSFASCVFDPDLTIANGHLVKVLGWYDNEVGYSSRLVDLAELVGSRR